DCEHNCTQELHPVLAIAIHTKDDPDDDRWAFMAHNAGDQGDCGRSVLHFDRKRFRLRLWRPTKIREGFVVKKVEILHTSDFDLSHGASIGNVTHDGQTALLELDLPLPKPLKDDSDMISGFVDGEIHLKWTAEPAKDRAAWSSPYDKYIPRDSSDDKSAPQASAKKKKKKQEKERASIRKLLERLPPEKRAHLAAVFSGKDRHKDESTERGVPVDLPPDTDHRLGEDIKVEMRPQTEEERTRYLRAVCEAFGGSIPDAPADACKGIR